MAQEAVAPSAPAIVDRVESERDVIWRKDSVAKMDSTLITLVGHLEKEGTLPRDVTQHVTGGKVLLQVWLTDSKPDTIEKLKEFGFEVVAQPKTGHLVIGRLSIEKLDAFSKLSPVRYITLQRAAD